ncbi:restriction endonuclease subunit S [Salipaludibacillus aurantiacus]|uniref:Type I restriction enzyme, S subunit n=1 Tax=Salipaludibacillus aurantiacus TaxID=1601833 RepID=A0A1H9UUF4_9BACI|nr:restriction endonuclease subunit S [Salipaludibacillus aurantiacus]SES12959.1 type I restriction enzyme, S subunit [Salipaludibacillus aurantiacus]
MSLPSLRFNFQGEWQIEQLGYHLRFIGSGVTPRGGKSVYQDDGVLLLRSQNIHYEGLRLDDVAFISDTIDLSMKKSRVIGNDVLLNITGASIGRTCIVPSVFPKSNVNQHVCILRTIQSLVPSFLKTFLESPKGRKNIFKDQAGQTREALNLQQIKNFKIGLPEVEEQQKIADFFSLLDRRIEKQQEKVEALKEQKKGLLQKIFKQELRFKDDKGNVFPDWNYMKAADLFETVSDKDHRGDLPILAATQDEGLVLRESLDRHFSADEGNYKNYKRVYKNDFVISLRSFQGGIELSFLEGLVSPAYTIFRPKNEEIINHNYFKLIFKSTDFITKLNGLTYGIRDGKAISFKDFSSMKLYVPSFEEQSKVASYISIFERKIDMEHKKLKYLHEQKKGFMQQMFV